MIKNKPILKRHQYEVYFVCEKGYGECAMTLNTRITDLIDIQNEIKEHFLYDRVIVTGFNYIGKCR